MQPKRVLIVDDEPNVTMVLAGGLEKLGEEYAIDTAHSGDEALAKMEQTKYALLITDYKMPGMDGLDLAQTVRAISPDTQVILMTAYGNQVLRDTAEHLGLDGYIDKPFSVTQIRELVKRAVGGVPTARRILVVEDNADLLRLYSKALRKSSYQVHEAATLQEARDLLTQCHFDALLCDIHMGDEQGTDLVREHGEALRESGTQIIMVTGDAHYRPFTDEMGVEFYLEKPVAISTLVTLVDRLTARR